MGQGHQGRQREGGVMMKIYMAVILVSAAACSITAHGADYPSRPIRMIVPQAPGSASDTVARLLAAELTQRLKQQFIISHITQLGD